MRMHIDNIPSVVAQYFDSVVIPAAQGRGGLWAFGSGFIAGMVSRNSKRMVDQYLPVAKQLGIVDEQNMLDIEMLHVEATKAMQKGKPEIMGYTMDQSDIDRIRDIMNQFGS